MAIGVATCFLNSPVDSFPVLRSTMAWPICVMLRPASASLLKEFSISRVAAASLVVSLASCLRASVLLLRKVLIRGICLPRRNACRSGVVPGRLASASAIARRARPCSLSLNNWPTPILFTRAPVPPAAARVSSLACKLLVAF